MVRRMHPGHVIALLGQAGREFFVIGDGLNLDRAFEQLAQVVGDIPKPLNRCNGIDPIGDALIYRKYQRRALSQDLAGRESKRQRSNSSKSFHVDFCGPRPREASVRLKNGRKKMQTV